MVEVVGWRSGELPLLCRVCDWKGDGEYVADIVIEDRPDARAIRCPECYSLELLENNKDMTPDDESVDSYVEGSAGIEAIAGSVAQVNPAGVRRFLDVGCNYGFALDLGRFLHGWEVVGVEPSHAGRRGADELGVEIRNVYLDDEVDLGADFDLILASEVIEHVPDPLAFLQMLGRRLTPTGAIILTTPASEIVRPEEPVGEILAALTPGYHIFLASQSGLEQLLRRAGFRAVEVVRTRGALKAAASFDPAATFRGSQPVDDQLLEPYYNTRADTAAEGSSLALGMATRHLRLLVSQGRWAESEASATRAIATMRKRHRLNLARPERVRARVIDRGSVPSNLHGLAFALGMQALLHERRPERAAEYFELAITSVNIWEAHALALDPDSADLRYKARWHLGLALADIDPEAAARVTRDLSLHQPAGDTAAAAAIAHRQCRLFVDLVSDGNLDAARELLGRAMEHAPALAGSADPEAVRAGLDALVAVGMLRLNTGDPEEAAVWFARCLQETRDRVDDHSTQLAAYAEEHLALARTRLRQRSAVPTSSELTTTHMLDVYWCDSSGVFVEGWAFAHEAPSTRIQVRSGSHSVDASRHDRLDVLPHYPGVPHSPESGFTAYVPGSPRGHVVLSLHTAKGVAEIDIELPDHPVPELEAFPGWESLTDAFGPYLDQLPPGPVLFMGQRQSTEEEWRQLSAPFRHREIVGLDIHPGWGVDLVGDAHQLSAIFGERKFAAVLSASLLEHVTTPWLVALEVAKVLVPGGYSFHAAPWMWPTHSMPNDFWRFTTGGLEHLFSPGMGFETVQTGDFGGVSVMPMPDWRETVIKMSTTSSHGISWLISRKVSEPDPAYRWPYDAAAGEALARNYPVDGLPLECQTRFGRSPGTGGA